MRYLVLGLGSLLLAACANIPNDVQTDAETVSFAAAKSNPERHSGATVRWAGLIAEVSNREESTVLEVVVFDQRRNTRPQVSDQTPGRFRVVVNEFLDPEVYARGRSVTALGEFTGMEEGQIGDFPYWYPTVAAAGLHLWPEESERVDVHHHAPHGIWYRHRLYGTGPYRIHPYYHPYGVRIQASPERPSQVQPLPPMRQGNPRRQEQEY